MPEDPSGPDLSAIGTEIVPATPTEMARSEEKSFELDCIREQNRHELEIKRQDLGSFGRVFGSRDNAITYVVAALVIFSLLFLALTAFFGTPSSTTIVEIFKGIAYMGMGYLTGKSLEAKKE